MNIAGNERVDPEAKKAAKDKSMSKKPFRHRPLKSSHNQVINANIDIEAKKEWETRQESAAHIKRIEESSDIKVGRKLYNEISTRKHLAWLIRLRTGHCSLNQYLHRFNIMDDPTCACGQTIETVRHYLIHCKNYER